MRIMYFSKTYWKSKACPEKTDQQKGSLELHDVLQAVKEKISSTNSYTFIKFWKMHSTISLQRKNER